MYVAQQDSTTPELFLASPDGLVNEKISGPIVASGNVSALEFACAP